MSEIIDIDTEKQIPVFACKCEELRVIRILFDGGDHGNYTIEYCQKCYDSDDKQFLISEERFS